MRLKPWLKDASRKTYVNRCYTNLRSNGGVFLPRTRSSQWWLAPSVRSLWFRLVLLFSDPDIAQFFATMIVRRLKTLQHSSTSKVSDKKGNAPVAKHTLTKLSSCETVRAQVATDNLEQLDRNKRAFILWLTHIHNSFCWWIYQWNEVAPRAIRLFEDFERKDSPNGQLKTRILAQTSQSD
jgi:hypothetical protein